MRSLPALLVLLAASPALAKEPSPFARGGPLAPHPSDAEQRQVPPRAGIWWEGQYGWNSPLGIGTALDMHPCPWTALNLGVGLTQAGVQLAFMPRIRLVNPNGRGTLSFGYGSSIGPHTWSSNLADSQKGGTGRWDRARWHNVEVAYEVKGESASWRVFLGGRWMFSMEPDACSATYKEACGAGTELGYVGVAVGGRVL